MVLFRTRGLICAVVLSLATLLVPVLAGDDEGAGPVVPGADEAGEAGEEDAFEQSAPDAALQGRLLRKAVTLLKPGGMLVYCTCSLEPEEGPDQIAALLAAEPGLARAPVGRDEVAGLDPILTPEGDIRTLPSHLPHDDPRLGGLDGFYAARLIKA